MLYKACEPPINANPVFDVFKQNFLSLSKHKQSHLNENRIILRFKLRQWALELLDGYTEIAQIQFNFGQNLML